MKKRFKLIHTENSLLTDYDTITVDSEQNVIRYIGFQQSANCVEPFSGTDIFAVVENPIWSEFRGVELKRIKLSVR